MEASRSGEIGEISGGPMYFVKVCGRVLADRMVTIFWQISAKKIQELCIIYIISLFWKMRNPATSSGTEKVVSGARIITFSYNRNGARLRGPGRAWNPRLLGHMSCMLTIDSTVLQGA